VNVAGKERDDHLREITPAQSPAALPHAFPFPFSTTSDLSPGSSSRNQRVHRLARGDVARPGTLQHEPGMIAGHVVRPMGAFLSERPYGVFRRVLAGGIIATFSACSAGGGQVA